jgi:hypothetical protein
MPAIILTLSPDSARVIARDENGQELNISVPDHFICHLRTQRAKEIEREKARSTRQKIAAKHSLSRHFGPQYADQIIPSPRLKPRLESVRSLKDFDHLFGLEDFQTKQQSQLRKKGQVK